MGFCNAVSRGRLIPSQDCVPPHVMRRFGARAAAAPKEDASLQERSTTPSLSTSSTGKGKVETTLTTDGSKSRSATTHPVARGCGPSPRTLGPCVPAVAVCQVCLHKGPSGCNTANPGTSSTLEASKLSPFSPPPSNSPPRSETSSLRRDLPPPPSHSKLHTDNTPLNRQDENPNPISLPCPALAIPVTHTRESAA